MNSYSKWDQDAHIERVGGPRRAERRRKALLAQVDGYQLAEVGEPLAPSCEGLADLGGEQAELQRHVVDVEALGDLVPGSFSGPL